jgi:hypothetical protein
MSANQLFIILNVLGENHFVHADPAFRKILRDEDFWIINALISKVGSIPAVQNVKVVTRKRILKRLKLFPKCEKVAFLQTQLTFKSNITIIVRKRKYCLISTVSIYFL